MMPSRRGSALITALMVSLAGLTIVVSTFRYAMVASNRMDFAEDRAKAFYLCEAGLSEAYAGLCIGRTGNIASSDAPSSFGGGLIWVEATDHANGAKELECTAVSGRASVSLSLVVEPVQTSASYQGLRSSGSMYLGAGVLVDGYDSSQGAYDSQTPTDADISIGGSFQCGSDVTLQANVEGTLGSIDPLDLVGVLTGDFNAVGAVPDYPSVDALDPRGASQLTVPRDGTQVIPSGAHTYSNAEIGMQANCTIVGPATLELDTLLVRRGATLELDTTSGAIDLVLNELAMESGSTLVTSADDPSGLTIQVAGSQVQLEGTGNLHGYVYAPDSAVIIGSDMQVFGSVVANHLKVGAGANLHMDMGGAESRSTQLPHIVGWRIVEFPDSLPAGSLKTWRTTPDGVSIEALATPLAESHEDLPLTVTYRDVNGSLLTYSGMESGFDWSNVSEVMSGSRDGQAIAEIPPLVGVRVGLGNTDLNLGAGATLDPSLNPSDTAPMTEAELTVAIEDTDATSRELRDALMVSLAGLTIVVAVFRYAMIAGKRMDFAEERTSAFYLAEAGLAESYAGLCVGKTGNIGTSDAPADFGGGLLWVEASDHTNGAKELECTAVSGRASVTLSVVVEPVEQSVSYQGLRSAGDMALDAGALVDGYDSSSGAYDSQASTDADISVGGSLAVDSEASLQGNLEGTLGGIDPLTLAGVLTGTLTEVDSVQAYPSVEAFDVGSASSLKIDNEDSHLIPSGDHAYSKLEVKKDSDCTIVGPATIHVDSLKVHKDATLEFDTTAGSIDLLVDKLEIKSGSTLVTTTGDPSALTIQSVGGKVKIEGDGELHGFIYAPDSEVTIGKDAAFFGGIVALDLEVKSGASLHMDMNGAGARSSQLPHIVSWRIADFPESLPAGSLGSWRKTPDGTSLALGATALSQAHRDQYLSLTYRDAHGTLLTYNGMESGFDWSSADEALSGTRDGEPFLSVPPLAGRRVAFGAAEVDPGAGVNAGAGLDANDDPSDVALLSDTDLQAAVDDPLVTPDELKDFLIASTPVNEDVMKDAIKRDPPLDATDLLEVLMHGSPGLPEKSIESAIKYSSLNDSQLTLVLIENSPLHEKAFKYLGKRNPPLNDADYAAVMDAQTSEAR